MPLGNLYRLGYMLSRVYYGLGVQQISGSWRDATQQQAIESSIDFTGERRKNLYALDTRHQIRTEATFVHASVPACLNHAR